MVKCFCVDHPLSRHPYRLVERKTGKLNTPFVANDLDAVTRLMRVHRKRPDADALHARRKMAEQKDASHNVFRLVETCLVAGDALCLVNWPQQVVEDVEFMAGEVKEITPTRNFRGDAPGQIVWVAVRRLAALAKD